MHKKTETIELDIPKSNRECWDRYPKYRWVYELTRLLDAQHIKWSPYETDEFCNMETNIRLEDVTNPGKIYTKVIPITANFITSEVYIVKGEIKLMRQFDSELKELTIPVGEVELRVSALVTLYFQKFTGVITVSGYGNEILNIDLMPIARASSTTDTSKLIKRIYKKSETTVTVDSLTVSMNS
jgi:hypothetical protein